MASQDFKSKSASGRPPPSRVKFRFIICVMATLCPVVCYISRQNLSLAIVSMVVDEHNSTEHTVDAQLDSCPRPTVKNADGSQEAVPSIVTYGPKYNWTAGQRSSTFEAFFFTYVFFQVPAARMAEKLGAKWILATATIGSSVLSLVSPWAASLHVYALAFTRALMGVCQTALYPACYVLYSKWLPPSERSQALPMLSVGAYVGSIIAAFATGYFSEQPTFGWEYAFYLPALLCALWSVRWVMIGTSEPQSNKYISDQELNHIEFELRCAAESEQPSGEEKPPAAADAQEKAQSKQISWRKLFGSQHLWAMVAAFFASNWSFTIVLLLVPTYLNDILYVPPLHNGYINSIIYILFCVASPIVGTASTMMIETRPFGLSRLTIRKLFQSVALFGQAICFVALPLIGCDTKLVMFILFLQIVLYSFVNGGEVQIPAELSLDFSGTIYAIGNCVGSATGFIVPRVHSLVVQNRHSRHEWELFFYGAAAITTIGGCLFVLFGRNDMQDYSRKAKPNITHDDDHCCVCTRVAKLHSASYLTETLA